MHHRTVIPDYFQRMKRVKCNSYAILANNTIQKSTLSFSLVWYNIKTKTRLRLWHFYQTIVKTRDYRAHTAVCATCRVYGLKLCQWNLKRLLWKSCSAFTHHLPFILICDSLKLNWIPSNTVWWPQSVKT